MSLSRPGMLSGPPEHPGAAPSPAGVPVPLSAVLIGMSRALDLAEGHAPGHAVRACLLGLRLGRAAGLSEEQLAELYHGLLLKDAGGSSNAARIAALFGADDQTVKPRMKVVDREDRRQLALESWRATGRKASLAVRVRCLAAMMRPERAMRDLVLLRAERGASLVERLGFPVGTVEAIRSLNAHWNGNGDPGGLQGEAIPVLSRIMHLVQTIDLVMTRNGAEAAEAVVRARRGRWFDPSLTDAACALLRDDALRRAIHAPEVEQQLLAAEPAAGAHWVDDEGLDEIAQAFAGIVDAKSQTLQGHSPGVARYARAIGERLGLDPHALRGLGRAGLLRDLGMLGVSSRILEKAGPLNAAERTEIEQHPVHTWQILRHVPGFSGIAMLAAMHHERLDGSGYPWRKVEEDLDTSARALVVADVFQAALGDRAFRRRLTASEALMILDAQRGLRLDGDAVDALAAALETGEPAAS